MTDLFEKKEIILDNEKAFANAIGTVIFERPKVTFWMIMLPILLVYFFFRLQKIKNGRLKFSQEFMVTRQKAMELALEAVETGKRRNEDETVRQSGLKQALARPYGTWLRALVDYYSDLLAATGDSFETLARSAYRSRTDFLLILNRLNTVEKDFYAALKPHMAGADGAAEIIAAIQEQSRNLRRSLAERIFP